MKPIWEKLFNSGPGSAPIGQHLAVASGSESGMAGAAPGELFGSTDSADPTLKSAKVARSFDSIGRRNETLRAQLDSIEFSFRNIEAIRTLVRVASSRDRKRVFVDLANATITTSGPPRSRRNGGGVTA